MKVSEHAKVGGVERILLLGSFRSADKPVFGELEALKKAKMCARTRI
jgi:hypothetical protein